MFVSDGTMMSSSLMAIWCLPFTFGSYSLSIRSHFFFRPLFFFCSLCFGLFFQRGTWGCAALLRAAPSSFTPRIRPADASQHQSLQNPLWDRGLVCHIRRRQATKIRSFCREDPSREARRVSASLTLIIFAERRLGSVDSWMCDWCFWFHYICTHGDMFSSVVSTDWRTTERGTYGWTALCPCCTVQVCPRIGKPATWSRNLANLVRVCENAVPICDI